MGVLKTIRKALRIPEPFRAEQFADQRRFDDDYSVVAESLLELIDFESVVDLGCANGLLLGRFMQAGKSVSGVELSAEVREYLPTALKPFVEIGDFSSASGEWDLACCMEVAEHLTPKRSEELVAKLTSLATAWVYFTAAPPGQGGHGHINCRPMAEWLAWFEARDWKVDEERTAALQRRIATLELATWLSGNSVILAPGKAGSPVEPSVS